MWSITNIYPFNMYFLDEQFVIFLSLYHRKSDFSKQSLSLKVLIKIRIKIIIFEYLWKLKSEIFNTTSNQK